jgi:acyl carrier protein
MVYENVADIIDDLREFVTQPIAGDVAALRLREDLGLDSLGAIELLITVEDRTGRVMSEDDVVRIETVADLYDWARGTAGEIG